MKIRNGFVSNSSSSSFVIKLKDLTDKQIMLIRQYDTFGKALGFSYAEGWEIWETAQELCGETTMDNFDMYQYLIDIGIPREAIDYSY